MSDQNFQSSFRVYMDGGDYQAAATFARVSLSMNPKSRTIAECLGIALWMSGEDSQALDVLEPRWKSIGLSTTALIVLVRCLVSAGRRRPAKLALREAMAREDCPIDGLPAIAASLGRTGEYSLALQVCHKLTICQPDFPDAWYGVAYYQQLIGVAPQILVRSLTRALTLEPRCLSARMCLANVHAILDNWEVAYRLITNIDLSMIRAKSWLDLVLRIARQSQDRLLEHLVSSKLAESNRMTEN
jgi:hypothetical protein